MVKLEGIERVVIDGAIPICRLPLLCGQRFQPAAADGIGYDFRILAMSGLLMSPTSRPTGVCHLLTHLTAIAAFCGERYTSSVKHGTELI